MAARDIGIDLGTANVLIYVEGEGILLNEPSVVALDAQTDQIMAIGQAAYDMIGRAPGDFRVVRPLKDGVISDFDVTEAMLTDFVNRLNVKGTFSKPNIMIAAPTNITEIERKAIIQAAEHAGGARVTLEYEPKVAAVGAGLDIFDEIGDMVIDIGGGTSDIAVLSLGDIVASESLRMAGDRLTSDIQIYLKKKYNLLVGESTAERIKIQIGSVIQLEDPEKMEVRGNNVGPDALLEPSKTVVVTSNDTEEAMHETIASVLRATRRVLSRLQPGLAADIKEQGIVLTGGGANLRNLDVFLSNELGVSVRRSETDPLTNVAEGAGRLLELMNPASQQRARREKKRISIGAEETTGTVNDANLEMKNDEQR